MSHKDYSTQRVSDEYMTVNSCGEQYLGNADYDTLRENGRVDFGMQFIEAGRCTFEDNGKWREAPAGSLLLHFPHVRQHYCFSAKDNTHLMWVHFSGTSCAQLDALKSEETVLIKLTDPKGFKRVFDQMLLASYVRRAEYATVCSGYTTVLVGLILQSITEQQACSLGLNHERMIQVIGYMNYNFEQPIDLQKYADMCYVSRSRFSHLFKEYTGMSPYRFQLKIRMERAVELLEYTALSVEEIAQQVGYEDCSYFCRIFKRLCGHTPLFYRKNRD